MARGERPDGWRGRGRGRAYDRPAEEEECSWNQAVHAAQRLAGSQATTRTGRAVVGLRTGSAWERQRRKASTASALACSVQRFRGYLLGCAPSSRRARAARDRCGTLQHVLSGPDVCGRLRLRVCGALSVPRSVLCQSSASPLPVQPGAAAPGSGRRYARTGRSGDFRLLPARHLVLLAYLST